MNIYISNADVTIIMAIIMIMTSRASVMLIMMMMTTALGERLGSHPESAGHDIQVPSKSNDEYIYWQCRCNDYYGDYDDNNDGSS